MISDLSTAAEFSRNVPVLSADPLVFSYGEELDAFCFVGWAPLVKDGESMVVSGVR